MRIACIPARGEGSRVRELRADGNKLLLDVAGRTVLDRQLELLEGFDRVVVLTIPRHVDAVRAAVEARADVRIIAKAPRKFDGPILSLLLGVEAVADGMGAPEDLVTFLFSDTLFAPGTRLLRFADPGVVVVAPVRDGSRFVTVEADDEGWACRWHDHPAECEPALATVGVYTLPLAAWGRLLDEAEAKPNDYGCFSRESWRAVRTDAWFDVGTVESYRETCRRLSDL